MSALQRLLLALRCHTLAGHILKGLVSIRCFASVALGFPVVNQILYLEMSIFFKSSIRSVFAYANYPFLFIFVPHKAKK